VFAVLSVTGHAAAQGLPSGWAGQDIGAVGLPGSASGSGGTFTVRGAGADIWGRADSFHFANQLLAGDGEIVARVASIGNTHSRAKAGVMIREALTAGSRHVILDVKPDGGVEFMARAATGGTTAYVAGGTGPWLRLVRSNGVFTAYVSPDGAAWTSVGSRAVEMGVNVWVGLAVCSHTTSALNTAQFDHVSVESTTGVDRPPAVSITSPGGGATFAAGSNVAIAANATDTDATPVAAVDFHASDGTTRTLLGTDTTSPYTFTWSNVPAGSYSLTAVARDTANQETTSAAVAITVSNVGGGSLPQGWASQDIGAVGLAGSAGQDAGTFTVRGAGADIWGSADSFHFVNRRFSGDGEIVARVLSMENTHSRAKAGVMIRETLTAGSRHVILDMKPGGGAEFMTRSATAGSTAFVAGGTGRWLKVARSKGVFTAYVSSDGVSWATLGSRAVAMGADVWAGLAVCSHTTSALNTALFDNVSLSAAPGGTDLPPTVSITSPSNGATFSAGAGISIAANASDDTGPVAKVDFYVNNGTANVLVGTDTTTPYSVSWGNVAAGSYSLTAVATDTANQATTSIPVSVTVSAGGGTLPAGWASLDIGAVGLPGSANYTDGFFTVGGAGAGISGTADSFHFAHRILSGDGQITARVLSLSNANAKVGIMIRETLTPGSRHATLWAKPGGVEFVTRTATGGTTMLVAGGTGEWSFKLVRSNGTIIAYVRDVGGWKPVGSRSLSMASNVSVGLVVCSRDTASLTTAEFDAVSVQPASGVVQAVRITGPPDGSTFPPGTGIVVSAAAAVGTSPGVLSHVEFWANDGTTTKNIGHGFSVGRAGTDEYSYTPWWHNVPAGSYLVTAVATYGRDELVTSQPVRVNVSTTAGTDLPPTVVFTNPTAGTRVPVGSTITVTAEANDPDATPVARVDFWESTYEGARLLGSKSAPPYAVTWSDGGYTGEVWLLAVVTDTAGLATSRWLYVTR